MEDGEKQPPQHPGSWMPEAHRLHLASHGFAGEADLSLQLLFQALSCQRGVYLAPLRVGYAEMQEGSTRQGEVQCCHLEPWVMKFKYVYCSVKKRIGELVHSTTKRASVCVFNIHLPSGSCV